MSGKALRINLQEPRRVWHPGDTVTGHVVLDATDQVDVERISISFEGRAKSRVQRRQGDHHHTYRGLVILFKFSQKLFQGPFTLKPGSMQWPFEFQIPESRPQMSRVIAGDVFQYPSFPKGRFNNGPSQPLPPSMDSENTGFGSPRSCYINYRLTANLSVTGSFKTGREFICGLQLRPYREIANPEISYARSLHGFDIRTLHLIPEATTRSLNFKERMKTVFSPSSLPTSLFSIALELPRSAIAGQPMHGVRLFLEHDLQHSTAPELPLVYLKKFTLTLQQRTSIMVKAYHLLGENDDMESWDSKRLVASWQGKQPLAERVDLSAVLAPKAIRAPAMVPTFRTFNVAVEYSLLAEFSVECAQQKESRLASVGFGGFVLYAPECREVAGAGRWDGGAPPEVLGEELGPPAEKLEGEEEEPLPAYSR